MNRSTCAPLQRKRDPIAIPVRIEGMSIRSRSTIAAGLVVCSVGILIAVGVAVGGPQAGPQRPRRDDLVLLRVPAAGDVRTREVRGLERRLAEAPGDLETAVRLARLQVEEARRRGDPRFLGYAEAALGRWWDETIAPAPVLLLRATIRQSRHEFEAALADLDALVAGWPDEPQGWLTRAVVLTVRGRYPEARASCVALGNLASPLVRAACVAPIDGLTGRVRQARQTMETALAAARTPGEQAWAHSILGELCAWGGDAAAAERHLAEALRLDPDDRYARGLLADLLLDRGRAAEARALVAGRESDDGLLLRLALAEAALAGPRAAELAGTLRARFSASRQRGEAVHQREEARFVLGIEGDAHRALALAKEGWGAQHEPWDARLLLETAHAAGEPAAAAPVVAWLAETGFEGLASDRRRSGAPLPTSPALGGGGGVR
jgi:Flp pilus assembly protein TadD